MPDDPSQLTVEQYKALQNKQQLDLLVVLWYVNMAFGAIPAMIGFFYAGIGLLVGLIPEENGHSTSALPSAILFGSFALLGLFLVLVSAVLVTLSYLTARSIKARRNLTLIYVVGGLNCLHMPLGLALSVFTFIVVTRPEVKCEFV